MSVFGAVKPQSLVSWLEDLSDGEQIKVIHTASGVFALQAKNANEIFVLSLPEVEP